MFGTEEDEWRSANKYSKKEVILIIVEDLYDFILWA
jgi:hypothetical protein